MTDADLSAKVMIISLNISVFTGERVDHNVTAEIASKHRTTSHEAGRFSKQIIGKGALEAVRRVASEARAMHYDRTLPWSDQGGRLLSVTGYMQYTDAMRALRERFDAEVEMFMTAYPRLIEDARLRLNTMFDVNDYPAIDGLRHRFSFDVSASPLPTGKNWFLDMAEDQMECLRLHADERLQQGVQDAVKDAFKRVADVTLAMSTKLADEKGVFRDSLVGNVRELAELIPSLNITDDPSLAALQQSMQELTKFGPSVLRNDKRFRAEAADKAQLIHDMASALL